MIKLKGCGKLMAYKRCVIRDYKGKPEARYKCGDKFPYDVTIDDRFKYKCFYCNRCKRQNKLIQIAKWKKHYFSCVKEVLK